MRCKFSVENKIYYIEQVDGTQEYIYSRPIKLNTYGSLNSKNNINIIWSGTNNIASSGSTIDDVINAIDVMVQNLNHKKYIVVGLTSKNYHDDIVEKNKALGRKFGKHFIDIRKYILNYGLEDMGITPTDEDSAAISGGEMPPSLLSDVVHFNSIGYELIANLIYKKGQDLEYW